MRLRCATTGQEVRLGARQAVEIDQWALPELITEQETCQRLLKSSLPSESKCPLGIFQIEHVKTALEPNVSVFAQIQDVRFISNPALVLV